MNATLEKAINKYRKTGFDRETLFGGRGASERKNWGIGLSQLAKKTEGEDEV